MGWTATPSPPPSVWGQPPQKGQEGPDLGHPWTGPQCKVPTALGYGCQESVLLEGETEKDISLPPVTGFPTGFRLCSRRK